MSCNSSFSPCNDCPPQVVSPLPVCVGGEPCEETYSSSCVYYTGPNLPALNIENQDRFIDMLTKIHKIINELINTPIPVVSYTATNTDSNSNFIVNYLSVGPVYNGLNANSIDTSITVSSTTGLEVGMTIRVTSGIGSFAEGTIVVSILNDTTFTVSIPPITVLSNATIRASGDKHKIFSITIEPNMSKTFDAFFNSPIKVSGTGTIV